MKRPTKLAIAFALLLLLVGGALFLWLHGGGTTTPDASAPTHAPAAKPFALQPPTASPQHAAEPTRGQGKATIEITTSPGASSKVRFDAARASGSHPGFGRYTP